MKITCSFNSASIELVRIHLDEFNKLDNTIEGFPVYWTQNKDGYIVLWPKPSDKVLGERE